MAIHRIHIAASWEFVVNRKFIPYPSHEKERPASLCTPPGELFSNPDMEAVAVIATDPSTHHARKSP
jgi:hypothetical protein